ncbi:MAG: hypothetical protein R2751_19230 [Bacteroidales bacterium]
MKSKALLLRILLGSLVSLFPAHQILAQDDDLGNMHGFVELGTSFDWIVGSFNGNSWFELDEGILLVPKIQAHPGVGITLGYLVEPPGLGTEQRQGNPFGMSFSYYRSSGTYTTLESDYQGECTLHLVRYLGFIGYPGFDSQRRLHPFFDLDFSMLAARFETIAHPFGDMDSPMPGKYVGIIFGMGGGLSLDVAPHFALNAEVLPQFLAGSSVKAEEWERADIKKFGNFMLHSTLSLRYYFKPWN